MKVFVTGGAGFIGSHLIDKLVSQGDQVVTLDDLSTGRESNLQQLFGNPSLEFHVGSAADFELVQELMTTCDVAVHLAAAVGVRLIVKRPVHTIETNVQATMTVLEAAAKDRKPVLLASSSEVYGKSKKIPFREQDDLVLGCTQLPRWSYACSKALDEWLAMAYWQEQRLPTIVARMFNTVGPRQTGQYGMVLPRFIHQALSGADITVYGDGKQSRCFAHVHDIVEALTKLLCSSEAVGEVFNVGTDHEIEMAELAHKVHAATNSRSRIRRIPYAEAYAEGFEDMMRRVPDLAKLKRTIGYVPSTTLDEIIADIIKSIDETNDDIRFE